MKRSTPHEPRRQSGQSPFGNRTKSSVRVRVEHVFGAQTNDMGGTLVRTIGLVRAKARIGMKNLPITCAALSSCAASTRTRHEYRANQRADQAARLEKPGMKGAPQ